MEPGIVITLALALIFGVGGILNSLVENDETAKRKRRIRDNKVE
jgi:hypothetical protein